MHISHQEMIKAFDLWTKQKILLHFRSRELFFRERQVWWTSIGQNIGSEQNGKHERFERPVLIMKKFNKEMFLGIPLSRQNNPGSFRYIFQKNDEDVLVNISQIRTMSSRRLLRRMYNVREDDFMAVWHLIIKMKKKIELPFAGSSRNSFEKSQCK